MLTLAAVAGLLTGGVVAPAGAVTDSEPPVVQSVTVTPSFVDVGGGPGTVTVILRITDDLSGLSHGYVAWRSPSGKIAQYASFVPGMLSSGTIRDGVYLSSVTMPRYSEPGEWKPAFLFVRDVTGNVSRRGSASDLAGVPSLAVADTPDTPPTPAGRPVVHPGDRAVTVRWAPVRSSVLPAVTSYVVTAMPGGNTVSVPAPNSPVPVAGSATLGGLVNGRAYTFTVRAVSSAGVSAPSLATAPTKPRPAVSFTAGAVTEGDTETVMLPFTVALSSSSSLPISFTAATVPTGTVEGVDYTAVRVHLTFAPGETSKTILVPVLGDVLHERTKTVVLALSELTNADPPALLSVEGQILDNDPQPVASISNASVVEGDDGRQNLTFEVTLSEPSGAPVSFRFATVNDAWGGTASPGWDFVKTIDWCQIAPGRTTGKFSVQVFGDTRVEGDETVVVRLTPVDGVTLASTLLTGTIVDDDQP